MIRVAIDSQSLSYRTGSIAAEGRHVVLRVQEKKLRWPGLSAHCDLPPGFAGSVPNPEASYRIIPVYERISAVCQELGIELQDGPSTNMHESLTRVHGAAYVDWVRAAGDS